jgi:predicted MFS family arabinose efflux permease
MFFLGVATSLVGAAARNIGLSPFQIGMLITIQNIGFIIAVSISGTLSDTQEKPRILFVGSLILAASFLTFYLSDIYWINFIIMLFIGIGIGTYEGVTDAMLLDIHTERIGLQINVNHLFVTVGSALITVYLIFLEMNWRKSIIQAGIIVLLLAIFFALTKLEVKSGQSEKFSKRILMLAQNRTIVILFLITILAVGVELSSIGILTTYLMDLRDFTQLTSKIGLITFLAGVASGRLIIGLLTREDKIVQLLLSLFGCASIIFLGLYFFDLRGFTYPAIFLAGITLSAMLPLIITLAGVLFKDNAGTVIGVIKAAIPLGGILLPFIMSLMARYSSFQASLLIMPLVFMLAFGLLFIARIEINPQSDTP